MKSQILGRLIAMVLIGILFACLVHSHHVRVSQMGRDAYLARQGERYDRLYAKPESVFVIQVFVCVIMTGVVIGTYELIAFGFSKGLRKIDDDESKQPPPWNQPQ